MIALWLATALGADVQRYAVVVGTNEGMPGDEPLVYAESDAVRFAEVLQELGDVRSEDVVTLRRVTADRLRDALEDLAARIERRRSEGSEALLFFYYSGHADSGALHLGDTPLPFDELGALLTDVPVDVRVAVVDACQSGELTRLKGARPAEPFEITAEDRLDSEGIAIITSSSVGEDAQESDRVRGGLFTHHFVAGLLGAADRSGDQRVTLNEAYAYGRTETIRATSRTRFVQHPAYAFQLRGRSDVVLTRLEDPGHNGVLALPAPGHWLVFEGDGSGDLVTEVRVDDQALLTLAPGDYLVRQRDDRGIREQPVSLERGETLELEPHRMAAVSPGATVRKGLESERHTAWALTAGGGVAGSPTPGLGFGPLVRVGALVDLEPLTLTTHLAGARHRAENDQLTLNHARLGVEVGSLKKLDLASAAIGLGLHAAGDVTAQWFHSEGTAPPRQALSGRVGPVVGLDLPLGGPRGLLTLTASSDIHLYERFDADADSNPTALTTSVIPTLTLEAGRYVR